IVKASLLNAPIVEVPVILYHDGRKTRQSHLRTFRDGWRTFRMFLELRFAHRRRRPLSGTGRYWTEET
ncbi:MAG TPA: hypothetical protein VE860_24085, partial [Chthoniobacterales bacterium]|nr:hypothetical protein [Chthoniobacterales bacterium]